MKTLHLSAALFLSCALFANEAHAAGDPLKADFYNPPNEARPRVWWHWLDGNVSQEGIDKDLAWMKRVGLGGVQTFDGGFGLPPVVPHPAVFMSPEWKADFRHAVEQAAAQGLGFTIASSPGWSESGGPWVRPEQAMKKLVWSETTVEGGRRFAGRLPQPPANSGPFADLPVKPALNADPAKAPVLYHDSVVVAFRASAAEAPLQAAITASSPIDGSLLGDGKLATPVVLPFGPGDGRSWIQFDFGQPRTVRAMRMAAEQAGGAFGFGETAPEGQVQASDDGHAFRPVLKLPVDGAPEQTVAFAVPITARYFRVVFEPRKPTPMPMGLPQPPAPTAHRISELVFEGPPRVHRFEDKAGWSLLSHLGDLPTPAVGSGDAVATADVVDLTGRMTVEGALDWTPPPGRWIVLRMGWSPTGVTNHPATPAGTGLEVDKLNSAHVRAYLDAYLGAYADAAGKENIGPQGLSSMLTDSYEAGPANWTDDILAQFRARRGYDPTPWLPVLTGRVVKSAQASDAFLWDWRRTLGDLIAQAHYGQISEALHARGMRRYGESHESGRAFIGDGMEVKKTADLPMGAMWAETLPVGPPAPTDYDADLRESASVAHLYGQNLVAAESFTAAAPAFGYDPQRLKPIADRMFIDGVNHLSIHTSAHQPVDTPGPGLSLGPIGQWFTRKETWAEMARPWVSYLARSSAMLQAGHAAADILWFYGEDDNVTSLYGQALPRVPAGYAYDFVNADALTHILSVEDGRITTPGGGRYAVLVLAPEARRMSLATVRGLRNLVEAGAAVVGAKPEIDVSLSDDAAEFRRIADALWSGRTGKGRVLVTGDLASVLGGAAGGPDVDDGTGEGRVQFLHRRLPDGEAYFVSNPSDARLDLTANFRVTGKAAEIWRADTGGIVPASYRQAGGRTAVPLTLGAHDAVFVVFRQPAAALERRIAQPVRREVAASFTGWSLSVPADGGPPIRVKPAALRSWTDSDDPAVKYFSGTATYRATLDLPKDPIARDRRLILDLGEVKNLAEVRLNGQPVGIAWKTPFEVDITSAAKAGANELDVRVANLWPNRLIGDKQPGAKGPHALVVFDPFQANSPLLPSGLLGPVRVIAQDGG